MKKLTVRDWYEPSRLSVIDYCNEWKFLKVIWNKWIIFKKQGTDMNLRSLCSLFSKTFQFTCFPVSSNSVMNTVASPRPNLHTGLAADTSNSMYIFSDSNELVILRSFSQPQLLIPTLRDVMPCNVITVLPWRWIQYVPSKSSWFMPDHMASLSEHSTLQYCINLSGQDILETHLLPFLRWITTYIY